MSLPDITRPPQQIILENRTHFVECKLKLCFGQIEKNCIRSKSSSTVRSWHNILASQRNNADFRLEGSLVLKFVWRCRTALVVACSARMDENTIWCYEGLALLWFRIKRKLSVAIAKAETDQPGRSKQLLPFMVSYRYWELMPYSELIHQSGIHGESKKAQTCFKGWK